MRTCGSGPWGWNGFFSQPGAFLLFYDLPALRIGGVEVTLSPAGHGGTAPAKGQQLTFGTLFKLGVIPIRLHLTDPNIGQPVVKHIAYLAVLDPAAGVYIPGGQDRQMTVSAVASAVDDALLYGIGNFENAGLVFIQCPKMVLFVKPGLTARRLVLLHPRTLNR